MLVASLVLKLRFERNLDSLYPLDWGVSGNAGCNMVRFAAALGAGTRRVYSPVGNIGDSWCLEE